MLEHFAPRRNYFEYQYPKNTWSYGHQQRMNNQRRDIFFLNVLTKEKLIKNAEEFSGKLKYKKRYIRVLKKLTIMTSQQAKRGDMICSSKKLRRWHKAYKKGWKVNGQNRDYIQRVIITSQFYYSKLFLLV